MTHPYADLEELDLWRAVDGEIASLEQHSDLQLSTARPYVVGALCRRILAAGLVFGQPPRGGQDASGPAGTAAVILRLLGVMGVLQAMLGIALQLWMQAKNVEGGLRINSTAVGMAGLLIYLIPSVLLVWFAKPIGRQLARGL